MSDEPVVAQKSPFAIEVEEGKEYYWCSCGRSKGQPFCDGSHKGTEFRPKIEEVTEAKKIAWCGCKQSSNGVHCDGTHANI